MKGCSCGKRGHMEYDAAVNRFFHDNERFADIVNGTIGQGRQVVEADTLTEADTRTGLWKIPGGFSKRQGARQGIRDVMKKCQNGMDIMMIGIENQQAVHYLMPLRCMAYDVSEYEKQASLLRKKVRKRKGVTKAEFLSGFTGRDRLSPCLTIVLYYGDDWDGSRSLCEMLNLEGIPEELRASVNDYKMHLVEVKKLTDKQIEYFQTDVRQVFDFIRHSKDKEKLRELAKKDSAYQEMDEDAYDVAMLYSGEEEMIQTKQYYDEGGKMNMGSAIREMIEDGRQEGLLAGEQRGMLAERQAIVYRMLLRGMPESDICEIAGCDADFIEKARREGKPEKRKKKWGWKWKR